MRADENLGRRVSEKKPRRIKRIRRNIELGLSKEHIIPHQIFNPPLGKAVLSVDRLSLAPVGEVADIAKRDAKDDNRIFYGWAVVLFEFVLQAGIRANPSPIKTPPNPFHADLALPAEDPLEEIDKIQAYTYMLAKNAKWLPCP